MRSFTPSSLDGIVSEFCEQISPGQAPVWLDNEPVLNAPKDHCFPIVEELVAQQGGEILHGWAIWLWPEVMIEAEFHGVWRDPRGALHDVVPRPDGTKRILFVPDPESKYEGRQVNNIRLALTDAQPVHDFIQAHNDRFELLNRGEYAEQHGEIRLTRGEAREMQAIEQRKLQAEIGMLRLGLPVLSSQLPKINAPRKWVSNSAKKRGRPKVS